jgi:hypothetical protein
MLTKEQISLLQGLATHGGKEIGFQAKELLKAYRNTPEGLKDRFILENTGIFSSLLEEDPTTPSATTESSPEALAPYMGAGLSAKLKDIDLSQEPSAVRVYNPSKKELNKRLKRNAYDYYTAYTGKELEPENLSNFVKDGSTEYGLLKVLDRLPDEDPKAYNIRIAEIARNLGYDVPDTDPDYISIRGQLAKDLMDQQILESRKLAMQDYSTPGAGVLANMLPDEISGFVTETVFPRSTESLKRGEEVTGKDIGLDAAENAAMFIPNPATGPITLIPKIGRIASKAGAVTQPLAKGLMKAASTVGNAAAVPFAFEGADDIAYDDLNNPREEFDPGQASLGSVVNAAAPQALKIGVAGVNSALGRKVAKTASPIDKYKEFQDFKTNQNLSDAYTRKGAGIYGKYNIGPKQAGTVKNIDVLNRSDKELRALGLSPEEKMTAQNIAVSKLGAKKWDKAKAEDTAKNISDDPLEISYISAQQNPYIEDARLKEMIRRGQTEEAAQIMTDNTGNKYTYYNLPKDQPAGWATRGATKGEVLKNTGVPRMTISEGGRELDPLEINKAYYAYYQPKGIKDALLPGLNPNIAPYDREKKWLAYNGLSPLGAYVTNKLGRSKMVKRSASPFAAILGETESLNNIVDKTFSDPAGAPYESVPDTSYYQEDSTARKNPYIIKYILPASK